MKNISAAQLVPMLRPLIPQQGHLAAYPSGNMLIISDRASNVSRIMRIIQRMDESGDEPVEVIPLHNASATELVRTVNPIEPGSGRRRRRRSGQGRGRRTHQQRAHQRREVAAPEDQGIDRQSGHPDADRRRHPGAVSALRRCRKDCRQAEGPGRPPRPRHRAARRPALRPGARRRGANVDASVTIWADVATNALIMTAPPKIMKSLMAVIDKLDIRRAQVQGRGHHRRSGRQQEFESGRAVDLVRSGQHHRAGAVTNFPAQRHQHRRPGGRRLERWLEFTATQATTTGTTTGASALSSSTFGTGATLASRPLQRDLGHELRGHRAGVAQRRHE